MDDYVPWEDGFEPSAVEPGAAGSVLYATDYREASKLQQFYPADSPWWEGLAKFGITRAIDAHYGAQAVDKSLANATYAAANGRTVATGKLGTTPSSSTLVLLGLGVLVIYALNSD